MTTHKKLKGLVRTRMDKTGEAYTVARRHVLSEQHGYREFGGIHPETASLANLIANRGITDPTTDL